MTEPRSAEGRAERYPSLVADLLSLQVDAIVAVAASVRVLKEATSRIPIVMPGYDDPVGQGLVQSLAHPGGNITGLSFQSVELIGKQLELLKEVAPTAAPVAVLRDNGNPSAPYSSWLANVRAGDQPQDCQSARPDYPAVAAAAGRPGDRVR